MYDAKSCLFLDEIDLESTKFSLSALFFNIIAADTTGPARHPRPTSSTPAKYLLVISNSLYNWVLIINITKIHYQCF